MKKSVYIEGEGCNRRLLELTKIKSYLSSNGYEVVNSPESAEYLLAGTCAFKEREENDSVTRLRELRKYNGQLLVYGCLPDIAPDKYDEFSDVEKLAPKDIDNIDSFFGGISKKYQDLPDFNAVDKVSGNVVRRIKRKIKSNEIFEVEFYRRGFSSFMQSAKRVCLNVDDDCLLYVSSGCLGKCSYCAIRMAVGSVRSKSLSRVKEEFLSGLDRGCRSFTILGDDPGCYGLDKGSDFPELLNLLLEEIQKQKEAGNLKNITLNINEIHPKFMIRYGKELCRSIQHHPNIIKSILCPIQSGSDRILQLMQREHNAFQIKQVINEIRMLDQNISFSTHIIVGFPSETREDLEKTWSLVKDGNFNSVVVFPYHDKKHTAASSLSGKITPAEIRKREKESFRYFSGSKVKAFRKCPK